MTVAPTTYGAVTDEVIAELKSLLGDENVLTELHERAMRAANCAPFPLHRWADQTPDVVVLPGGTDDVVAVLKLANERRIPVTPRGGASGLADGAMPLRKGICVDIKRMHEVFEIDEENSCVTVGTGINPLKLNEILEPLGKFFPDDLAGYANAVIGGRIGCGGWTLIGGRYGHIPDTVISMECVLPDGQVIWVGGGGTRKVRKSSSGYRLKDLFMQHQGTLCIVTRAVLELYPKPEVEFAGYFAFDNWDDAYNALYDITTKGFGTISSAMIFDDKKIDFLRRDDEAFIPLHKDVTFVDLMTFYGLKCEVEPAVKEGFKIMKKWGGKYLGPEQGEGDWASRHDRYHLSYHGRTPDGQATLMSWHCEDTAAVHSELPALRVKFHEIVGRYMQEYPGMFDDWGIFIYTSNPFKGWGDYLIEIDVGVAELQYNTETWDAWIRMKKEIANAAVDHDASVSICHGSCREGDDDVAMHREMANGPFDIMKKIKRLIDPNNIMNPGKYCLDEAYDEVFEGGARS
jgi:glycolate oxidase